MTIPTQREYPQGLSAADAIAAGFPVGTRAEYQGGQITLHAEQWRDDKNLWYFGDSGPLTIVSVPDEQPAKPLRYDGELVAADCIAAGMPVGTRVRPWGPVNAEYVYTLRDDGKWWRDGAEFGTPTVLDSLATGPGPAAEPERGETDPRLGPFRPFTANQREDMEAVARGAHALGCILAGFGHRLDALEAPTPDAPEERPAPPDSIPVEGLREKLAQAITAAGGLDDLARHSSPDEAAHDLCRALTGRED